MSDVHSPWTDDADEDAAVRLLRLSGARPAVPADRAARVRTAVHMRWRTANRRRAVLRRGLAGCVLLATLVVLTTGYVMLFDRRATPVGEPVAVVEQTVGIPQRRIELPDGSTVAPLSPNEAIRAGEWIETDAGARVAVRFADGTSVRVDVASRARPLSSDAIELAAGAVYVDSGREWGRFEVRTRLAIARDIGTQFEVRLLDRTVRLRVRSGIVELMNGARSVSGRAGTEITLNEHAAASRPIAVYGSEWDWTARVSPPLEIEGMSLSSFLERVVREHGWTLDYADTALARKATGIILHGSVNGLSPREAVDVAIATSGLRHRLEDGELVVLRSSEGR